MSLSAHLSCTLARRLVRRVRARAGAQDGFTIIEVLVASVVLTIGIVALFSNFSASQKLGNSAESHQTAVAVAEGELERIRGLKWSEMGMRSIPARSTESTNPTFYELAPETAKCTNRGAGAPATKELEHCYEWKWSETSTREPMVYEVGAENAYENPRTVTVASVAKGATTRLTFKVYRFITWVTDTECKVTTCEGSTDAKRVLVAVTGANLKKPVVVSSIINDRELSGKNPLQKAECEEGATKVPCIYQK